MTSFMEFMISGRIFRQRAPEQMRPGGGGVSGVDSRGPQFMSLSCRRGFVDVIQQLASLEFVSELPAAVVQVLQLAVEVRSACVACRSGCFFL